MMGDPCGMDGGFIKNDYLVVIITYFESLPPKSIILCKWLLIGSRDKCCLARSKILLFTRVAHSVWKIYTGSVYRIRRGY